MNCHKCAGNGVTYPKPNYRAVKCAECGGTGFEAWALSRAWLALYAIVIGIVAIGATIYYA